MTTLKVHSIFESISGEAGFFPQGSWTTFLRLQGCGCRCYYCDTKKTQQPEHSDMRIMTLPDIVKECGTRQVLITGGEPLMQPAVFLLINALLENGHAVQVETNGSYQVPFAYLDKWLEEEIYWVIDRKGPSSGQSYRMVDQYWKESDRMTIKYVISNEFLTKQDDLFYAAMDMKRLDDVGYRGRFIISPMDADESLIQECVEFFQRNYRQYLDRITFSLQLHKIANME